MARIIRHPRAGETVEIHQIAGQIATVNKGTQVLKLWQLSLDPIERIRFADDLNKVKRRKYGKSVKNYHKAAPMSAQR